MSSNTPMKTHLTTRRAFIAAMGFGGVSLYALWAAYGAAPGPLELLGLDERHDATNAHEPAMGHAAAASDDSGDSGGGHGGHGAVEAGPDAEEFRRMTDAFVERYRLPDGTVHPRVLAAPAQPVRDAHGGHGDHPSMVQAVDPHAGHGGGAAAASAPIDVLIVAGKWYYQPATLRLDAGQAYRFRMMALDVSHGASIQFGKGGRMVRLRPGRVAESEMTFRQPGRYLMYCTVYCGPAHDVMQATIEVV
ncbi:MAG: hypothetical protein HYS20_05840 [Rhodocyclales bacterium]|nr:hypothetical protein [Rhodocyclales bacterium]